MEMVLYKFQLLFIIIIRFGLFSGWISAKTIKYLLWAYDMSYCITNEKKNTHYIFELIGITVMIL